MVKHLLPLFLLCGLLVGAEPPAPAKAPEPPTDKDAIALVQARLRVYEAQLRLTSIYQNPIIVAAQNELNNANAALEAEQEKHQGCELVGATWICSKKK